MSKNVSTAGCVPLACAYAFHAAKSGSTLIFFTRSSVTMSNSCTDLLYSGGLPAVTMIQPSGTAWRPNVLNCKNCNMEG